MTWQLGLAALAWGYVLWRNVVGERNACAQRDRFWLRELAIHDHAIEKGLERWTDTRRIEWFTPNPTWMGLYDLERDRLADRDETAAREDGR